MYLDSRPQLRPTCNQRIVEVKRQGRKISDVIHGVVGPSIGKSKSKAVPFEEDFVAVGSGPMKIQSWAPDEDDLNATSQNPWQELQGYENTMANSSQEFQRDSIQFQQHYDRTSNFLQRHLSHNEFGGKGNTVPRLHSNVQNSFGPSLEESSGAQVQRPSAFQQAMSTFQRPISPAPPQPSVHSNVAAPVFQPSPPNQTAPAFQKTAGGVFSQTAPAFSSAVTAPASAFGGAFSAVFGKPSPSPSPALQEPSTIASFVTKAVTPNTALKPSNLQSQVPHQVLNDQNTEDQAEAHWHDGTWDNEEGQHEGQEEGDVYYGEYNILEIDEDDELATQQADLARRQEEVAQRKMELYAQLEEAKRILVEKEAAQQKKKEKEQSELRQRLLKHRLESQAAQHKILQSQQQQPPSPSLAVQDSSIAVTSINPSPPAMGAFDPSRVVSSGPLQISQSSPVLNQSIASELEQPIVLGKQVSTSNFEVRPLAPPPEKALSQPLEGPEILLERFSLYG